ncbi:MAG: hypothetical protein ACK50J_00585, partial [Planctomyces sp.]
MSHRGKFETAAVDFRFLTPDADNSSGHLTSETSSGDCLFDVSEECISDTVKVHLLMLLCCDTATAVEKNQSKARIGRSSGIRHSQW